MRATTAINSLFDPRHFAAVALTAIAALASAEDAPFTISTIESPVAGKQVALAGDFDDSGRSSLFVVTTTPGGDHVGRLYRQDENGAFDPEPVRAVDLDHLATVVDTGTIAGRDVIVWLSPSGVIQYDPLTDTVRRLASGLSLYASPTLASLPRIDFLYDVTGDGLDDLVIPDFNGYRVYVQRDGRFAEPAIMQAPPTMDMSFDNHPWYQPQPLYRADMNADGRVDVVFWNRDHFRIYPLGPDGLFVNEPIRADSSIAFDLGGTDNLSSRLRDEDQSNLTLTALYRLKDLSGDGVPELVTLTINSEGVFKKETTYQIYRGAANQGTVTFITPPMSTIASRGIQFETDETDLESDGDIDLVISSVRLGIGKVIGALLTGSVDFDLDFYPFTGGRYAEEPSVSRQVTATFDLASGDFFYPFVLLADVTGDGVLELLVQEGTDTLQIYEGTADGDLFARRSNDVSLELPFDADLVELTELNGDGRRDLLMRIENKNQKGRVTALVSRQNSP